MRTSLSYLVDNLPEIYKKECKRSKSGCDFIGIKNNKTANANNVKKDG